LKMSECPNPRVTAVICMHRGAPLRQEDAIWASEQVFQSDDLTPQALGVLDESIFAIADGVAASPMASTASRLALEFFAAAVAAHSDWTFDALAGARHVRAAQSALCDAAKRGALARGASTTVVAAHLVGDRVAILNSGDSRAYVVLGSGDVGQLSQDHTVLAELSSQGHVSPSAEYASAYGAVTDCLIADPQADDFAVFRATTTLREGDSLVLCSDGVYSSLDREWPSSWDLSDPMRAATRLREAVLAAGALDNFSFIIIRVEETSARS
jgi:PPM family protein phosphatase